MEIVSELQECQRHTDKMGIDMSKSLSKLQDVLLGGKPLPFIIKITDSCTKFAGIKITLTATPTVLNTKICSRTSLYFPRPKIGEFTPTCTGSKTHTR
jgi:hypothetical protein